MADLGAQLQRGLHQMDLPLSADQQQKLLDFVGLLVKWNKVFNLTAITRPDEILSLHILDSLAVMPYVTGPRVADIGSGAGLPGIPLAIALPDVHFTLMDSNGKKTRFITQAAAQLGLGNVSAVHSRVEDFQADERFDTVLARAFTAADQAIALTRHLLKENGQFVLMKSRQVDEEIKQLPDKYDKKIVQLKIPQIQAERNLLIIRHSME